MAKLDLKQLKKDLLQEQRREKSRKQQEETRQVKKEQDQYSFQEAMSGVKPLSSNNYVHHEVPSSKPMRATFHAEEEPMIYDFISDEQELDDMNAADVLSYYQSGVQRSVFRKLRSGSYRISDELDLHGATVKQAKSILMYYLQEAVQFESCCIRIIHGKGHRSNNNKSILKTQVNHWLSEHERVLAFHSTKPKDGGTGAVYVLLKR